MDMFLVSYLDVHKRMSTLLAKVKHAFSSAENVKDRLLHQGSTKVKRDSKGKFPGETLEETSNIPRGLKTYLAPVIAFYLSTGMETKVSGIKTEHLNRVNKVNL